MDKILRNNVDLYKNRNLKLWMSRFAYESKSKNKLLFHEIKKSNIRMANLNIFDFGFGNGLNLFSFNRNNNLYGMEIVQNVIDFAQKTAEKKKYKYIDFKLYSGAGEIDFPDRKFDIIICSHVLEHHPDDKLLLNEFKRISKKEGKVFILIPINYKENEEEVHYRNYSVYKIKKIIEECNFKILQEIYFDKLSRLFRNYLYIEANEIHIKNLVKLIINFFLSVIPFSIQKHIENKIMPKILPTQFCITLTSN